MWGGAKSAITSPRLDGAIPGKVNCKAMSVIVDSECSRCMVYAPICKNWVESSVSVRILGVENYTCLGVG